MSRSRCRGVNGGAPAATALAASSSASVRTVRGSVTGKISDSMSGIVSCAFGGALPLPTDRVTPVAVGRRIPELNPHGPQPVVLIFAGWMGLKNLESFEIIFKRTLYGAQQRVARCSDWAQSSWIVSLSFSAGLRSRGTLVQGMGVAWRSDRGGRLEAIGSDSSSGLRRGRLRSASVRQRRGNGRRSKIISPSNRSGRRA